MADFWTAPKTNWVVNDGIAYGDLNRIEQNIKGMRDASYRKVQGFGYTVDNSIVGKDGVITVLPGSAYSENGYPIKMAASWTKNLTTWAQGDGSAYGGVASGVTVAAHTWYYIFVIMNPVTGATEIMIDDNINGTNISDGTYTEKRFINSFKTRAAGTDGSFDICLMYSTGDQVFIDPNNMFAARYLPFVDTLLLDNTYNTISLTTGGAEGYALPEKNVLANISLAITELNAVGFYSLVYSVLTPPANFLTGALYSAEFMYINPVVSSGVTNHTDFSIMVDGSRQVSLAMKGFPGNIGMAVRGFTDERLLIV